MKNANGSHWCNDCGYHSGLKQDVVRHIESKHLDQKISCKFCPKVSNTRDNLRRHIRKNHYHDKMDMKEIMAWHMNETDLGRS
jgi:hypothetical protein